MGDIGFKWMLTVLTLNIIGIAANLDNSSVGVAYGARGIKFPHGINAIVNGVGFGFSLIGAYLGQEVAHFVSLLDAKVMSCTVLVSIGLYFMYEAYLQPKLSTRPKFRLSHRPDWKQGFVLGVALSFSNVATGFGSSVLHTGSVWFISLSIGCWGYLLIWLGNKLGIHVFAKVLGRYSPLIAGSLLIMVGFFQLS